MPFKYMLFQFNLCNNNTHNRQSLYWTNTCLSVEQRLPWGVILLLGGGFALADITNKSGLSQFLVEQLDGLKVHSNNSAYVLTPHSRAMIRCW